MIHHSTLQACFPGKKLFQVRYVGLDDCTIQTVNPKNFIYTEESRRVQRWLSGSVILSGVLHASGDFIWRGYGRERVSGSVVGIGRRDV